MSITKSSVGGLERVLRFFFRQLRILGFSPEHSPRVKRLRNAALVLLGRKSLGQNHIIKRKDLPAIEVDVLLYCPVAPAGLTTQATQITRIFDRHGVTYQLTYYRQPEWPDHPLAKSWVPRSAISRPGLMLFMERVDTGIPYFYDTPRVMYTNLDWLKEQDFCWARQYMQVVLHPVDYRLDFIRDSFVNARTHLLKWPAVCPVEMLEEAKRARLEGGDLINVLYIGNDYDADSRKHPREVIQAILNCRNPKLRFWLKFRSPLPASIEKKLRACDKVERLYTELLSDQEIENLYRNADINLIPNASEGNGLSIIEALAKGVVPAVLDGYPMKTVIDERCGYLIPCKEIGPKRQGVEYQCTAGDLGVFLEGLDHQGILERQAALKSLQTDLINREQDIEKMLIGLANSQKLPMSNQPQPETVRRARGLYWKAPKLIDVYLSTYKRPDHLARTLPALMQACKASPYDHRITVLVDSLDRETYDILGDYIGDIDVIATSLQRGLPFLFNMLHDHQYNQAMRTERHPDFINYIQDDCLIEDPETFFEMLVDCYQYFDAGEPVGYASGYYTPVHPGFDKTLFRDVTVVRSDSIDGKHFFGPPRLLERIGKLTWYFDDGMQRGNPGPIRGSHFDLWQWSESPSSTSKQGLVNLILPGLCVHLADSPEQSTWNNDTTNARVEARIAQGRVYRTRPGNVTVNQNELFTQRRKN